jgi:hypothetical protein
VSSSYDLEGGDDAEEDKKVVMPEVDPFEGVPLSPGFKYTHK